MNEQLLFTDRIKEYLIRLENPYAKLSVLELPDQDRVEEIATEQKRREYIKRLGNPWANEGIASPSDTTEISHDESCQTSNRVRRITKDEFRESCRMIFAPYAPAKSRSLMPDHRDFIVRNENKSAERRFLLVEELRKYDVTTSGDFQTWFNREPKFFTAEKLRHIEETTQQLTLL